MGKITHAPGCRSIRELHIKYRLDKERFQIVYRCACGALSRAGRYLYPTYGSAERAMKTKPLDQLFTHQQKGAAPLPVPVLPTVPSAVDAWRVFWLALCEKHGHESRLFPAEAA